MQDINLNVRPELIPEYHKYNNQELPMENAIRIGTKHYLNSTNLPNHFP